MAAVESVREAMGDVLHRFIKTRGMTPQQAQAQLLAIVRGAGAMSARPAAPKGARAAARSVEAFA